MKCVNCLKPTDRKYTCSQSCAAYLGRSTSKTKNEHNKYDNKPKLEIRKLLYDNYILPKLKNKDDITILDFWGGGGFSDYIIKRVDQSGSDTQGSPVTLIEIDNDEDLHPALRKYAIDKTTDRIKVIPYCGSLADFCHDRTDTHVPVADFIWLDYCGTINKHLPEDLPALKKAGLVGKDTTLAVTVFKGMDGVDWRARIKAANTYVNDSFPMFEMAVNSKYKARMGVYVYKANKKVKSWLGKEVLYKDGTAAYKGASL